MANKRPSIWKHWAEVFLRLCLLLFQISLFLIILYRIVPVPVTPLMLLRGLPYEKDWVAFEKMSPTIVKAAITAEDPKFSKHHGFDFEAIWESINKSIAKGRKAKGRSTISQQTAKNLFFSPTRSWIRKGLEVPLTLSLEIFWTKRRIIEVYLNIIEMGDKVYGIEAASKKYFKKPSAKLSKAEAAAIVVCFPNPRKRNPLKLNSRLKRKQATIQRWMNGYEAAPDWWWEE
ncbi:MAG TPA: monofunctional biosynthetic peptidoglycan transglycosylase [Bacteroidetes bacterium]|nr:monofunctional biosynthetic peptidoglycan transglycosylase [Bacteroidota bacterium]